MRSRPLRDNVRKELIRNGLLSKLTEPIGFLAFQRNFCTRKPKKRTASRDGCPARPQHQTTYASELRGQKIRIEDRQST